MTTRAVGAVGVAGALLAAGGLSTILSGCESAPETPPPIVSGSLFPSAVETTEPTTSPSPTSVVSGSLDGSDDQASDQVGDFEQYRSLYMEFDPVLMALQNKDKETLNYVGVSVPGCEAAIDTMQRMLSAPEAPDEYREWQDTSLRASIALARKLIQSGLILTEPPVVDVLETGRLFTGVDDNDADEISSNLSFFVVDRERKGLTGEELAELRTLVQPSSPREKIWMDSVDEFIRNS